VNLSTDDNNRDVSIKIGKNTQEEYFTKGYWIKANCTITQGFIGSDDNILWLTFKVVKDSDYSVPQQFLA